jgi:hypothetical protein
MHVFKGFFLKTVFHFIRSAMIVDNRHNDIAVLLSGIDVTVSGDDFLKRIHPIDDRLDLPRFKPLIQLG